MRRYEYSSEPVDESLDLLNCFIYGADQQRFLLIEHLFLLIHYKLITEKIGPVGYLREVFVEKGLQPRNIFLPIHKCQNMRLLPCRDLCSA